MTNIPIGNSGGVSGPQTNNLRKPAQRGASSRTFSNVLANVAAQQAQFKAQMAAMQAQLDILKANDREQQVKPPQATQPVPDAGPVGLKNNAKVGGYQRTVRELRE